MEVLIILSLICIAYIVFKRERDRENHYSQLNESIIQKNFLLDQKEKEINSKIKYLTELQTIINKIENSTFKDTDIFAKLYADQKELVIDLYTARINKMATRTSQHIEKLKLSLASTLALEKSLEYRITKYEQLFPWIKEFKDIDLSLATHEFYEKNNLPPNVWNSYEEIKNKEKELKNELENIKLNNEKLLALEKEKFEKLKNAHILEIATNLKNLDEEISNTKKQTEIELNVKRNLVEKELNQKIQALNLQIKEIQHRETLLMGKIKNIPVLAKYVADIENKKDELRLLKLFKLRAQKSADILKDIKEEKKVLIEQLKTAEYKCLYYENLIPWLSETEDEPLDNKSIQNYLPKELDENVDAAKYWLSPEEYTALTTAEKYQMALERYCNRNKTNSEIGRDYERYIGYKYESEGYDVEYRGIIDGFEDRGRDLICTKENNILIVQCKCWSQKKEIHENHINQLFGTTLRFYLEKNPSATFTEFFTALKNGNIEPVFITSTKLSETAKSFANSLNITVFEYVPLKKYPMIKCNINRTTKEQIYHLPFDQQYDKVKIDDNGEFFAMTVQEAENAGFRRAQKWFCN